VRSFIYLIFIATCFLIQFPDFSDRKANSTTSFSAFGGTKSSTDFGAFASNVSTAPWGERPFEAAPANTASDFGAGAGLLTPATARKGGLFSTSRYHRQNSCLSVDQLRS
jgi:hypothetical protein